MSNRSLIVSWYEKPLDINFTGNSYYLKEGNVAIWNEQELLTAKDQQTMEASVRKFDKAPKEVRLITE